MSENTFPINKAYIKVRSDSTCEKKSDLLSYSYSCVQSFRKNQNIIGDLAALRNQGSFHGINHEPSIFNLSGDRKKPISEPFYSKPLSDSTCSSSSSSSDIYDYSINQARYKNSGISAKFQSEPVEQSSDKIMFFQWLKCQFKQVNSFWHTIHKDVIIPRLCKKSHRMKMEMTLDDINEDTKQQLINFMNKLNLGFDQHFNLWNETLFEVDVTPIITDTERLQAFLSFLDSIKPCSSQTTDKKDSLINLYRSFLKEKDSNPLKTYNCRNGPKISPKVFKSVNESMSYTTRGKYIHKSSSLPRASNEANGKKFSPLPRNIHKEETQNQNGQIGLLRKNYQSQCGVKRERHKSTIAENRHQHTNIDLLCSRKKTYQSCDGKKSHCEQNVEANMLKNETPSCKCLLHGKREDYYRYKSQCLFGKGDELNNSFIKFINIRESDSKSSINLIDKIGDCSPSQNCGRNIKEDRDKCISVETEKENRKHAHKNNYIVNIGDSSCPFNYEVIENNSKCDYIKHKAKTHNIVASFTSQLKDESVYKNCILSKQACCSKEKLHNYFSGKLNIDRSASTVYSDSLKNSLNSDSCSSEQPTNINTTSIKSNISRNYVQNNKLNNKYISEFGLQKKVNVNLEKENIELGKELKLCAGDNNSQRFIEDNNIKSKGVCPDSTKVHHLNNNISLSTNNLETTLKSTKNNTDCNKIKIDDNPMTCVYRNELFKNKIFNKNFRSVISHNKMHKSETYSSDLLDKSKTDNVYFNNTRDGCRIFGCDCSQKEFSQPKKEKIVLRVKNTGDNLKIEPIYPNKGRLSGLKLFQPKALYRKISSVIKGSEFHCKTKRSTVIFDYATTNTLQSDNSPGGNYFPSTQSSESSEYLFLKQDSTMISDESISNISILSSYLSNLSVEPNSSLILSNLEKLISELKSQRKEINELKKLLVTGHIKIKPS